ncbi:unnamed protein product [Ilex paraguariensis]|uniref:STICHEL DnaA-N-like alpha-beta domain-containing protein n=1 Tax=Ilex paraguariensis TaxID=185542 RepID=A0ABC8UQU4_9AQUA
MFALTGDNPNAESGDIHLQRLPHSSTDHHSISRTSVKSNDKSEGRCKEVEEKPKQAHMSDMEKIWQNIVERIQNKHLKKFLCHRVELASLSVSRANAIVHLMFKSSVDKEAAQISEQSISKALENAIGCPVTVNMSLEPASGIIEETRISIKSQVINPNQQQRTFLTEAATRGITAQESSSSSENQRAMKLKDSLFYSGQDRSPSEGKETHASRPQQVLPFLRLWTQKNQVDTCAEPERDILTTDQTSIDTAHIMTATKLKHQWLSLSSIPQSDVSVEPYSQDILFEKANRERERERKARKIPKFQGGHSKATRNHQLPDSAMDA